MQEINLLQNKVKDRTLKFERSNRLVMILFGLLLVMEVAGYGGLFTLVRTTNSQAAEVTRENNEIQVAMNKDQKNLSLAQGLQAQLKNVRTLLSNHVYWTTFFDEVSAKTPAGAQIVSISGSNSDGDFHVEGMGRSYQDIGRLILSLSTSDKVESVRLLAVSPAQGSQFGYSFSIDVTVDQSIFRKQQ